MLHSPNKSKTAKPMNPSHAKVSGVSQSITATRETIRCERTPLVDSKQPADNPHKPLPVAFVSFAAPFC